MDFAGAPNLNVSSFLEKQSRIQQAVSQLLWDLTQFLFGMSAVGDSGG